MSNNEIPWVVQEIGQHKLHNHLVRALTEIIDGDPNGFLPDSRIHNGAVKQYLQQAVLFGDKACLDALVANLRNAVFNFENMTEWMPIQVPQAYHTKSERWPRKGENVSPGTHRPDCPARVPFEPFHLMRQRCEDNHSQTPEGLADRGGLSPIEAFAILNNLPLRVILNDEVSEDESVDLLRNLVKSDERETEFTPTGWKRLRDRVHAEITDHARGAFSVSEVIAVLKALDSPSSAT